MKGPIYQKSQIFSLKIIVLYRLMQKQKEIVISNQLLSAVTSIGANINEASAASSRKDFIYKMTVASKEAREAKYWLELIKESNIVDYEVSELLELNCEIIKILNSIILTSQGKPKNDR